METNSLYLIGKNFGEGILLQEKLKTICPNVSVIDGDNSNFLNGQTLSHQIFIFDDFSGPLFEFLRKKTHSNSKIKIYGLPALNYYLDSFQTLPPYPNAYPLFCLIFQNHTFSVTGLRDKEKLLELRRKILYMGGSYVEKSVKVNYLIADKVGGERYRDACAIEIPIMKPDWIDFLWEHRFDTQQHQFDWKLNIESWKCRACHSLKIAFYGFDGPTKSQLTNYVSSMDGTVVDIQDPHVTHIVYRQVDHPDTPVQNLIKSPTKSVFKVPFSLCSPLASISVDSDEGAMEQEFRSPIKKPRVDSNIVQDREEEKEEESSCLIPGLFLKDKVKVVKEEWFWKTLQVQYCAFEEPYLLNLPPEPGFGIDLSNGSIGTPTGIISPTNKTLPLSDTDGLTPTTPISGGGRKRKRRDFIRSEAGMSQVVYPERDQPPIIFSEMREEESINLGGKSLDPNENSVSDSVFATILTQINDYLSTTDFKTMTQRQAEFSHLIETERNYVSILVNIVKNFKEPCENEDQPGGRILDNVEIKTIFDTILPIYSLHRRLLRDLVQLLTPWTEENQIGKVYCEHANEFKRAYEPFVNYFEATKAEIIRCENEKPRFMAFLKIAQGRAECGKQSLSDLMIRPVQRLPSTLLILKALIKRTKENSPDYEWMSRAAEELNGVNVHINEGKRVIEGRMAIFDIYNEIDSCPPDVVSSRRTLVRKIDVQSLSDAWEGKKNDFLTLFIFDDLILVTKRKNMNSTSSTKHLVSAASVASLRSPSLHRKSLLPNTSFYSNANKPYKFLEIIYHISVCRVVDILHADCFALIVRAPHEHKDRTLGFTLPDDPLWNKTKLLFELAKLAAHSVDRVDYEVKLVSAEQGSLEFAGTSKTVLEKASQFASKTRHKVTRALSSRTPSKSKLKRTMSQMMSPFSSKKPDADTISNNSEMDCFTPPMKPNSSTLSLWGKGTWASKRNNDTTPKSRKSISDRRDIRPTFSANTFNSIEEI